jgi:amino acid adenylation domain-containing protein
LSGHWRQLLIEMAAKRPCRVSELEILSEAEREQILYGWNRTEQRYNKESMLHELVEAAVQRSPEDVAAECQSQEIRYKELNASANQLAHHLKRLGVGPEQRVGVFMDRSIQMLTSMLAILKAGAAYVPIDPDYPRARVEFLLRDAEMKVVLSHSRLLGQIPDGIHVICPDRDWDRIAEETDTNPMSGADPANAAYVIYTSGSSGQPKGVLISHRSVCAFLHWAMEKYRNCFESMAATTSICFDLSVFEIFLSLVLGKRIKLLHSALELPAHIESSTGLLVNTVPSVVKHLQEAGVDLSRLAVLNMAGEPIPNEVAQRLPHDLPVWNLYGPSEDTTYSTAHRLEKKGDHHLIGTPIGNRQAYVLDSSFSPVPVGVTGELYLSGDGLAREYLNRPDLTAEKFLPNPFARSIGARMYRTGDMARYGADGNLDFLGRCDSQLKIRGYRIELSEIESVLAQHPDVQQAVAVAQGEGSSRYLVAFVVGFGREKISVTALRTWLKERLPDYLVPVRFSEVPSIPMTPNGKIDRRVLSQWKDPVSGSAVSLKTDKTQEVLVEIWKELLDVEAVGLDDNFFEIGGHSLLVVQMSKMIAQRLGKSVSVVDLFRQPSIRTLSEHLSKNSEQTEQTQVWDWENRLDSRTAYLDRIRQSRKSN